MQREKWLDSLRGGGILLVVIGHSGCPDFIYNYIYSFHMPIFFVISGYLYNEEKWEGKGIRSLVKSRLNAYIKPYLVLCGINYFLCLFKAIIKSGFPRETLILMKTWLWGIFYVYPDVEHMPDCTPLWFLVAIALANIAFFFVLRIKNNMQVAAVLILMIVDAFIAAFCKIQLPWCLGAILIGICCMYFGHIVKLFNMLSYSILVPASLFLVGSLASILNGSVGLASNIIGNNPVLFWVSALCLSFAFMFLMKKREDGPFILQWYGKNTMLFMGFNYFFNGFTETLWKHLPVLNSYNYNWALKSIGCVICISILIFAWDRIKRRVPQLNCLGF